MNGIEVRIPQVLSRDTELGIEGMSDDNAGAVELWKDGERILELVWWEKIVTDLATLEPTRELHSAVTHKARIHHATHVVSK